MHVRACALIVRLTVVALAVLLAGTGFAPSAQAAAPPVITGISPTAGPLSGGTMVTISGTNLSSSSHAVAGVRRRAHLGRDQLAAHRIDDAEQFHDLLLAQLGRRFTMMGEHVLHRVRQIGDDFAANDPCPSLQGVREAKQLRQHLRMLVVRKEAGLELTRQLLGLHPKIA
jgi:hypothetical protein